MRPLELAQLQIAGARAYTRTLLADIPDELWFAQPPHCPSHVAWQVAHLAMAQYGLTLLRIRGKEPSDQELISNRFFRQFKKGSIPAPDATDHPTAAEIRHVFDAVQERALAEMQDYTDEQLLEPIPEPYLGYPNKLGSLLFCAAHEMLHAGQIGLIRRMLGRPPVR